MKPLFETTFANLGSNFGSFITAQPLNKAKLLHYNPALAAELGLDEDIIDHMATKLQLPDGNKPFAMVYAGHQFGGFSAQLGDGRGALLGEVRTNEHLWDIHLKGIGKTPYSRFGDGRAVLRSTLREYLGSWAMSGLQIPSTQALAIATSTEPVMRETLETGASLLRVSECHIRFGHFEYFFYQGQHQALAQLIDYCAARYLQLEASSQENALALLEMATEKTAQLIAHWQSVGFAHGVLNTDNMSLIGETFDFGPFGFLDDFDPQHICNHSDDRGRYAFDRQASIGLWNLNALAHALSGFIDMNNIKKTLASYEITLSNHYVTLMMKKLGLSTDYCEKNQKLLHDLLQLLSTHRTDYTLFFRALSQNPQSIKDLFVDREAAQHWLTDYQQRCEANMQPNRSNTMLAVNPKYILRNHLAQKVIESVKLGETSQFLALLEVLKTPFADHPTLAHLAQPPADTEKHLAVSCSS